MDESQTISAHTGSIYVHAGSVSIPPGSFSIHTRSILNRRPKMHWERFQLPEFVSLSYVKKSCILVPGFVANVVGPRRKERRDALKFTHTLFGSGRDFNRIWFVSRIGPPYTRSERVPNKKRTRCLQMVEKQQFKKI